MINSCFQFSDVWKGPNNGMSAEQLHVLLHPTKEVEDETLQNSDEIVSYFLPVITVLKLFETGLSKRGIF